METKKQSSRLKEISALEMKNLKGGGHWEFRAVKGKQKWVFVIREE